MSHCKRIGDKTYLGMSTEHLKLWFGKSEAGRIGSSDNKWVACPVVRHRF